MFIINLSLLLVVVLVVVALLLVVLLHAGARSLCVLGTVNFQTKNL